MSHLADVKIGSSVRVAGIDGDDSLSVRLMEMGLTPGVDVSVLGTAPLGDPIEIGLRGYRLSLRKSEAARIEVQD